ncbi:M3 family metallopeptidase [Lentisalinibacter orientalis]|uniref:M3 family metallopeptidase n=1 Tax=Lentisalinibacter orientalis TaxID=2992241 RepID=UPI00386709E7
MSNPLLENTELPPFPELAPSQVLPAVRKTLEENRRRLQELLADESPTPESLVVPLEEMSHRLSRLWSPVSHLHMVTADADWREAYGEALPLLTEYATELAQNETLHRRFRELAERLPADADPGLDKLLEHALRDFRLAGVGLPEDDKRRFREIRQAMAKAATRFEQNLQDSTDAWSLHVEDEGRLAGLPAGARQRARAAAEAAGLDGWKFSLDQPTYQAVLTHADDEDLRRTYYEAWVTRASDTGPHDPAHDNAPLIEEILALRHEAAALTGFDNYAEYSLASKMAPGVDAVLEFLSELAERSLPAAKDEVAAVEDFAGRTIRPWDLAYYSEKLKQERHAISDEELRRYLPAPRVIEGLFRLAGELYGLDIGVREGVPVWHDSVHYYEVRDADGTAVGGFYADLYARAGKRGGAWIDECVVRKGIGGEKAAPVGYLVCNFTPPHGDEPSLLTHSDVVTLFHEFGHMLHHLLTRVDYPSIAGINGVPWDAVELPSQFMENFAWHYEVLAHASGHVDTGEPLPAEMFERLRGSRNFNAGLQMLRQLEFALFDFRLHAEYDPGHGSRAAGILEEVRERVTLVRPPDWNRFANGFAHIFAGGYAAGYYSYKWAEVLAADAFSAFEEAGIFDRGTAQSFRASILEVGGSRDIMDAFVEFRGRGPSLEALLASSGISRAA